MKIDFKTHILANDTITSAAQKLGVGRPALSSLLNGKSKLSLKMARKLETVYPDIDGLALLIDQLQRDYDDTNET